MRLRSYLFLLVIGAILPLLVFSAWLTARAHRQTRAATEQGLLEAARAFSVAVDRQVVGSISALRVLAVSEYLAARDLKNFDRVARRTLAARPDWETVALYDPAGRQVINLRQPFGSSLPATGHSDLITRVVRTRASAVSGLFRGPITGRLVVQIGVPVLLGGEVAYVVGAVLGPESLTAMLTHERFLRASLATLVDQHHVIIARPRAADEYVGQKITPDLAAAMATGPDGTLRGVTKDGVENYAAFSRSSLSGWTVVFGVPATIVDAPLARSNWLSIGLATLSLLLGLMIARMTARGITRPILSLSATAAHLLKGDSIEVSPTRLAEVNEVAAAMARASQESQRTEADTEALIGIGRELAGTLDLAWTTDLILSTLLHMFKGRRTALYQVDPPSGDLVCTAVAGPGDPASWIGKRFPRGAGLVSLAAEERQIVWTPDIFTDRRLSLPEWVMERLREDGIWSVLAAPLLVRDEARGALVLGAEQGRTFDAREVRLIAAFADQAALALENARTHAETERRRREAVELARTARLLTESLDGADIGRRVVETVQLLFHADAAVLRLLESDGSLRAIAVSGVVGPSFQLGHVLPSGVGLMGKAIDSDRAVWSSNIDNDPGVERTDDYNRRMAQAGARSVLAVPLRSKGRTLGALGIADQAVRTFSVEEIALFSAFGDQVALALENARLYESVHRQNEELARQSELLHTSLESISHGLIVFDADLRLVTWNSAFLDLLQLPPALAQPGRPVADFFRYNAQRGRYGPGDPEEQVARRVTRARSLAGSQRRFEWHRPDGVVVEVQTSPMPGGGVVSTYTDITERRQREEAVVKLSRAVQQTDDIVMITDRSGIIEYVNPSFEAVTGYARGDAIGKNPRLLRSGLHGTEFYQRLWDTILAGHAFRGVLLNQKKNGEVYYEAKTITPVRDEGGSIVNFVSTGKDITAQRQLEEVLRRREAELRQAQKMEAVGRLAGGVAHDFNNLLTVIGGRCDILLPRLAPDDPSRKTIELIQRTSQRAAQLTRQLLAFSRKQVLQTRALDLNGVVTGIVAMLRHLIAEDIELVLQLSPGLGPVQADQGQVEQILMNLVTNARDAMPRGGRITIKTENVDSPAGSQVMLRVSDTGAGMDAATRAQIFEPFFTTKEVGVGTGLGLATVHGIVQQHGGTIDVDSAPGQGATFTIVFPRGADVPKSEPVRPSGMAVTGHETILLVEDDADVRELTREVLEAAGYLVLEASDADAAMQQCERHQGPIHLLLTDVVMPKVSGPELARLVQAARPDIKILFVSGYTDERLRPHGVLGDDIALLEKPFTPHALGAKIQELLHGSPPASQA